jgi:hypothetical protein
MLNKVKSAIGSRLIQEGIAQDGIAEAQLYVDEVLSQFWESMIPKQSNGQQTVTRALAITRKSRISSSRHNSAEPLACEQRVASSLTGALNTSPSLQRQLAPLPSPQNCAPELFCAAATQKRTDGPNWAGDRTHLK